MRVAIVGAGAAGLVSARHVHAAQKIDCDVFEAGPEVGGVWLYTDDVTQDRYGYPIHTAMYKNLVTNLPKETMNFPDFPQLEQEKSFLTQPEILEFLNLYADHFSLRPLIKFNRLVSDIRLQGNKWQLTSIDKPTKTEIVDIYDFIFICNGHFHTPNIKEIPGQEKFKGLITHSHQYRSSNPFKDQRVLVIGGGPSGLDLTFHVAFVANSVVFSHHCQNTIKTNFPKNVTTKPDVLRVKNEEEVEFADGTCSSFDVILLCTGYKYNFPFLHESCGVFVDDNQVQPLYKQMVNIENTSMCFIGIPNHITAFRTFDLQVRFYCQYLTGAMQFPSKELMYFESDMANQKRKEKGYSKNKSHYMGKDQQNYFDDLASAANISSVPPVIAKLYLHSVDTYCHDFQNFRKDVYKIVNSETFVKLN